MKLLKEKILAEGEIAPGNILKVGSFLNQQMDVAFLCEVGKEFYRRFSDAGITKILTVEASGIGIACLAAQYFGVPVVFAKKSKSSNISGEVYSATGHSFTHGNDYEAVVPKKYLCEGDRILVIDDFLANGKALEGLIDIVNQAGAKVVGCTCAIEKGFQGGGDALRAKGVRVESLTIISKMTDDSIEFAD